MKMEIYGFKADVYKDGKFFIGEISELHIHDQAKNLRDLENELKDAVDTVVEFMSEKNQQKQTVKSHTLRSLFAKN